MKMTSIEEVQAFLALVDKAQGTVYLTSDEGDKLNLKSKLSQYVAMAALIQNTKDLELWCDNKEDEGMFLEFFAKQKRG